MPRTLRRCASTPQSGVAGRSSHSAPGVGTLTGIKALRELTAASPEALAASGCVLQREVTEGPYYAQTSGRHRRSFSKLDGVWGYWLVAQTSVSAMEVCIGGIVYFALCNLPHRSPKEVGR